MKRALLAGLVLLPLVAAATDKPPGKVPPPPKAATVLEPGAGAPAAALASATLADISSCMQKNYADRGSLRDVTITATDPEGKARQLKLKLHWKPTKAAEGRLNLRVMEPLMLAGSTYLLIEGPTEEQVYFHLPAANKTQKVSGDDLSRPLWGTDFSYTDVKLVQGLLVEGDTKRIADGRVGSRATYVLDTKTRPGVPYSHVTTYVDQESCVILKSDFFRKDETPVKTFEADVTTLSHLDPYWFVTRYSMSDPKAGTKTVLDLSDVFLLEKMPERLFDPDHFFEPFE